MTKQPLNTGGIIGVTLVVLVMCDVLLFENIPLLSINATQPMLTHWAARWPIVAVGLLPIYMAILFFGATLAGFFLGSMLQRWLTRFYSRFVSN